MEPHRDYRPHIEFGLIVWYKSMAFRVMDVSKDGKPVSRPTGISGVPTNTSDYAEACKQLDNKLAKKKEPRMDTSSNPKLF